MARQKNLVRRHEILRNTYMLLKKRGMENVSLQMIADKSSISKSLLQSYYPHKNLLITEIVTNFMTAVLKSLNATDFGNLNTYSKMKIFIYLILEQGIQDEGVERVVKSILSDNESLDRWSQILDDWLTNEGVKHDLGNDRQVQIGLNFIVTAGGSLYIKRTEFDLDADQISDIMVKTFMSTFLSIDESKISKTLDEAKSALQKYELSTLTQTINEMFDN
ncbi:MULTISPECIES: TetR/AcrR family transcriptional regulator [Lactobacillus]|uniref:TetR/AcrR family transcriptional regulator n=1 Tax=Lactobacillus TaxID=1578 RepID=UPI0023CB219A|nr:MULTISPECIES: TetR/AcrR family transcriptional regulator [Lactobacillus]MDE7049655.1 TetR/AcrR family transcriptional regulator [Lactobacillus sp.]